MEQDTSQVQEQIVALKAQVESNEALLKNVTAKVDNIEMLLRQNYEVVQQVCNRSQLEDRAMKDIDTLKVCMANFQRMCSEIVTVLDPQSSARSTPSPTIKSARLPPDPTISKGEPANLSRPLRKYAIPTPLQRYTLSRTIVTVQDLWREWTAGLEPGQPSVLEMNRKYGSAWRKDPKERKHYSRRANIIHHVHEMALKDGCTVEEAVDIVDRERAQNNWSLNRLTLELRKRRLALEQATTEAAAAGVTDIT